MFPEIKISLPYNINPPMPSLEIALLLLPKSLLHCIVFKSTTTLVINVGTIFLLTVALRLKCETYIVRNKLCSHDLGYSFSESASKWKDTFILWIFCFYLILLMVSQWEDQKGTPANQPTFSCSTINYLIVGWFSIFVGFPTIISFLQSKVR